MSDHDAMTAGDLARSALWLYLLVTAFIGFVDEISWAAWLIGHLRFHVLP